MFGVIAVFFGIVWGWYNIDSYGSVWVSLVR